MNENRYKYCPHCGAANDINAYKCAVCGAALFVNANASSVTTELDGVPVRDIALFVGDNAPIYLKKFYKKSQGKKCGINFIVLLLGIVFSAFSQSFWFFHRKMNKIGAAIFAIGILFTSASLYSAYCLEQYTEPLELLQQTGAENYLNSIEKQTSDENISKAIMTGDYIKGLDSSQKSQLQRLSRSVLVKYAVYAAIGFAQVALSVLIAAFADYVYYKFAISKIKAIRDGPNCCDDALRFCGGTKTVVWALLLILTGILYAVATLLIGTQL